MPPQYRFVVLVTSGVTIVHAQSNGFAAPAQLPLPSCTSDVPLSISR